MHDIKAIRETSETYAQAWSRRPGLDGRALVEQVLALDAAVRSAVREKELAEQTRNARSREIGRAKASGDEALFNRLRGEVEEAKSVIESAGAREMIALRERDDLLARLPNLPLVSVPDGRDETGNREVRRAGEPRVFSFPVRDHADLGEALRGPGGMMMDFEAAARMSGARFVVLRGALARLERALAAFMLDIQTGEHGYSETAVPLMVRDPAMFGTGQLPKFREDLFSAGPRDPDGFFEAVSASAPRGPDGAVTAPPADFATLYAEAAARRELASERYLIPTAEVSLTNLVRDQILDGTALPMRMTAATPCFRSEAGSGGRDIRGMIRQHQFVKVELVSIVRPEDSETELDRMTACAEEILRRLGLPFRTMLLCAGDMGFGARKTYDIEVWLPSQGCYREISSCSDCGDFQARRMDARFRRAAGEKPEFVHTLNGSGLAVGRTLVAVLENYQEADGSIRIPDALRPYMGGLEAIGP
ncbi:MAG: serine--tRNA ligase [Alphaproteobacteria bacterium]|nr:serine--tRNA ligase [Alphaproteobacteria bacterium]